MSYRIIDCIILQYAQHYQLPQFPKKINKFIAILCCVYCHNFLRIYLDFNVNTLSGKYWCS